MTVQPLGVYESGDAEAGFFHQIALEDEAHQGREKDQEGDRQGSFQLIFLAKVLGDMRVSSVDQLAAPLKPV